MSSFPCATQRWAKGNNEMWKLRESCSLTPSERSDLVAGVALSRARMPPVASSVASSSAAPYDANLPKKKKLPACGSCKMRRVLCQPQPPPASCPRCIDKGIVCVSLSPLYRTLLRSTNTPALAATTASRCAVDYTPIDIISIFNVHSCTTTPVVRKKPTGRTGKRIEEARSVQRPRSPPPVTPAEILCSQSDLRFSGGSEQRTSRTRLGHALDHSAHPATHHRLRHDFPLSRRRPQ